VTPALSCSMGHAAAQRGHFSPATTPPNVRRTHACVIMAWGSLVPPAAQTGRLIVYHVTPALSCREVYAAARRDLLSPVTMPLNVLKKCALALTAKASWETSVQLMGRSVVNHVTPALSCSMGHAAAQRDIFWPMTVTRRVFRIFACAIMAKASLGTYVLPMETVVVLHVTLLLLCTMGPAAARRVNL